jgi:spore maturation protein SpmB
LEAGKSAVELTLYVLLPVMVVMMALMRLLEVKGVLALVARLLAPVLRPFGVPGIGVFAMLQMLFVSYAAPVATLAVMEKENSSRRSIAATFAMILAMSQANASFPLLAVGLSLPVALLTSLAGGFTAAAVTHYLLVRADGGERAQAPLASDRPKQAAGALALLVEGGQEGVQLCLRSIPILVLAVCLIKALEAVGAIPVLERGLSPLLERAGLSGLAVLPLATKYLAGGTAMLGVATDLVNGGAMTAVDLNRVAGFMINPLDVVGVSVLASAGPRVASVARPAIIGAAAGILLRGVLHLVLF